MQPSERFDRNTIRERGNLIRSLCRSCGAMVGAAAELSLLELLEEAHTCKDAAPSGSAEKADVSSRAPR